MHFAQKCVGVNLHSVEGEPPFAQIFQRSTYVVNHVIDTEKTVVRVVESGYCNWLVLSVVPLKVECELLRNVAGKYLGHNTLTAFVEQGEHRVVNIIVEK